MRSRHLKTVGELELGARKSLFACVIRCDDTSWLFLPKLANRLPGLVALLGITHARRLRK